MAKYRVLVSVCYLLISVIYAMDLLPNMKPMTDAEKSELRIQIADEEEGKIRTVKDEERYFCPPPVAPDHATIIGTNNEMGSYIIVQCDPGYYLTGMMKIYCVALPNPFKKMAGWDNVVGQNPVCHPTSTDAPPPVDNQNVRDVPLRKNRSPDFLEDMGEPKSFKDDFAEIFEEEPKQEKTFNMETKMMYATELKDGKKGKINDFEIKPLKYKSHKFNLKEGGAVCALEPLTGPCRSRKRRYFYNIQTEECEEFIYGGCRGNGNNFLSKEECEESCAK